MMVMRRRIMRMMVTRMRIVRMMVMRMRIVRRRILRKRIKIMKIYDMMRDEEDMNDEWERRSISLPWNIEKFRYST